eukprot:765771-Hanusia_phi.AAC.2
MLAKRSVPSWRGGSAQLQGGSSCLREIHVAHEIARRWVGEAQRKDSQGKRCQSCQNKNKHCLQKNKIFHRGEQKRGQAAETGRSKSAGDEPKNRPATSKERSLAQGNANETRACGPPDLAVGGEGGGEHDWLRALGAIQDACDRDKDAAEDEVAGKLPLLTCHTAEGDEALDPGGKHAAEVVSVRVEVLEHEAHRYVRHGDPSYRSPGPPAVPMEGMVD